MTGRKQLLADRDDARLAAAPGLAARLIDRPAFILLLCLLAAIPVAIAPVLPLVDLGGHLGHYAVQVDAGRSADLAQW